MTANTSSLIECLSEAIAIRARAEFIQMGRTAFSIFTTPRGTWAFWVA